MSIAPIFIIFGFFLIKVLDPSLYLQLVQEDSLIEWAQFVLLIFTSLTFVQFFYREQRLIYAYLSIGFLFWSLEEVNWFQRLLMFETPNWFLEHNKQQELNLHNISPIHRMLPVMYFVAGCWLSFGNIFLRIYDSFDMKTSSMRLLNHFAPLPLHIFYFLPVVFIYGIFIFISPHNGGFLIWRDQEPAELLLILGLFLHIQSHSEQKTRSGLWSAAIACVSGLRTPDPRH